MGEVTTIGLDLAKHVFQVHGVDEEGATVLRKQLRRAQVLAFFSRLPPCIPLDGFSDDESYPRAALASSFNGYKAGLFERAQRPAFCVRLDIPFLQHQVGNEEAVITPQPLEVPQGQSD
jgi:hypothetical protein